MKKKKKLRNKIERLQEKKAFACLEHLEQKKINQLKKKKAKL